MYKPDKKILSFPLDDVKLKQVVSVRKVTHSVYSNGWLNIGPKEFFMKIKGVGSFYACDGDYVEIAPVKGVTNNFVELYLNGSVYGAILHQRKMLPLHGSSFETEGRGVMLCGESGAGKSSLTTSFCLNGAGFLTDDVSPVILRDGLPHILFMMF